MRAYYFSFSTFPVHNSYDQVFGLNFDFKESEINPLKLQLKHFKCDSNSMQLHLLLFFTTNWLTLTRRMTNKKFIVKYQGTNKTELLNVNMNFPFRSCPPHEINSLKHKLLRRNDGWMEMETMPSLKACISANHSTLAWLCCWVASASGAAR